MVHILTFVPTGGHDVEQRFKRWAGGINTAVIQVLLCNTLLRLDDVVDTIGKDVEILGLRLKNRLGKYCIRCIKNLA